MTDQTFTPDQEKIAETVRAIIAETCDIPPETITAEAHFIDGLNIDSLDFLDIAFAVDKAFRIKLPLERWTKLVNDGKATTDEYFIFSNFVLHVEKERRKKDEAREEPEAASVSREVKAFYEARKAPGAEARAAELAADIIQMPDKPNRGRRVNRAAKAKAAAGK